MREVLWSTALIKAHHGTSYRASQEQDRGVFVCLQQLGVISALILTYWHEAAGLRCVGVVFLMVNHVFYFISSAGDYLGHKRHLSWMFPPSVIAEELQASSAFALSFPCDADLPGHHGEHRQHDFIGFETGSVSIADTFPDGWAWFASWMSTWTG